LHIEPWEWEIVSEVFSKKQAAAFLKVSVETVNRNLKSGKLPYRKIGKRVVFTESDLAAFLDACAVPARTA
jgi:excisionase family DNA binding protein